MRISRRWGFDANTNNVVLQGLPLNFTVSSLNTVRLTVCGELVEPPAIRQEPFDKLRANETFLTRTVLRLGPVSLWPNSQINELLPFTLN
jgi:hypothetical protein